MRILCYDFTLFSSPLLILSQMETGIDALQKFARGLDRARDGILTFCKHRITSAKIEAFNATIERIVCRACGYRDLGYLYLKIRQEALET